VKVEAPYRVVSKIFESNKSYPAVVHIFYGESLREAQSYYQAHLKTDSFFRGCVVDKRFSNFSCHEQRTNEHWNGKSWVRA
jgi:hypothetical protein